ncbi:hypothetical protein [Tetragenococcus halophilus]|uniref:hypothetical protein n=1 Tax=Tetragenococcus halophilus TaxID=51669 RepID=UPI00300FFAF0
MDNIKLGSLICSNETSYKMDDLDDPSPSNVGIIEAISEDTFAGRIFITYQIRFANDVLEYRNKEEFILLDKEKIYKELKEANVREMRERFLDDVEDFVQDKERQDILSLYILDMGRKEVKEESVYDKPNTSYRNMTTDMARALVWGNAKSAAGNLIQVDRDYLSYIFRHLEKDGFDRGFLLGNEMRGDGEHRNSMLDRDFKEVEGEWDK